MSGSTPAPVPTSPTASGSVTPKAIGSLAKKQNDLTRQGTHKMKFMPTLPVRRKKDEVKNESTIPSIPIPDSIISSSRGRSGNRSSSNSHGRGENGGDRGSDRGGGRGKGRGKGTAPIIEMTASGPFAMGPALLGSSLSSPSSLSRQPTTPTTRSEFNTPSIPNSSSTSSALGENLTKTAAPTLRRRVNDLKKGKGNVKNEDGKDEEEEEEDEEVYSDADEGVEIIDMTKIREMDWMAPENLIQEKKDTKMKIKKEPKESVEGVDSNKALDLSESEEENELEDLIEDFAIKNDVNEDSNLNEDRLYFFQFPSPFPKFFNTKTKTNTNTNTNITTSIPEPIQPPQQQQQQQPEPKKVSFAPDTKPSTTPSSTPHPSSSSSSTPEESESESTKEKNIDGIIGNLEVYKSGAVKIRLVNGILFEVNAASLPSFLQQATYLSTTTKQLTVLGEINKQFVVSPDINTLLEGME